MKKVIFWQMTGLAFILALSGCTVRTYTAVKDRVDQDLDTGNKGYIAGKAPQSTEGKERKATRTTYVTEIELPVFAKTGRKSKPAKAQAPAESEVVVVEETETTMPASESIQKYKVTKGDTLEKIADKFYGTTKKWTKIYEANRDKLKAPDKIYPGQVLDVPIENPKK
ncbi:MAG: LysM peptidoglycan-binding domain-containing protein [Candidatus Omnitrophica bacterium]|nr:LysM peptidoglycan-binding domain-containing protein [Candidatus Omnitrophota bacterium]